MNKKPCPKRRNRNLRSRYGLSLIAFKSMLIGQGGKCLICGKKHEEQTPLVVDHEHSTNVIRGLLCTGCNTILGMAQDSVSILENAIEYLKSPQNGKPKDENKAS